MHCAWVLSIGTIVAEFWTCGSLVEIGLCIVTYFVYNIVDIGGHSTIVL